MTKEEQVVPSIYIPGTTPHCLVSTEDGNVNFLGARNLVYVRLNIQIVDR